MVTNPTNLDQYTKAFQFEVKVKDSLSLLFIAHILFQTNLDQYILKFGKIHFAIWPKRFYNMDKSILREGRSKIAFADCRPAPSSVSSLLNQLAGTLFPFLRLLLHHHRQERQIHIALLNRAHQCCTIYQDFQVSGFLWITGVWAIINH